MTVPISSQNAPYPLEVEAGKSYWWCACGKSQKQPLCDGSHQGSGLKPLEYKAEQSGTVYFCGCRKSKKGCLCDGSHQKPA